MQGPRMTVMKAPSPASVTEVRPAVDGEPQSVGAEVAQRQHQQFADRHAEAEQQQQGAEADGEGPLGPHQSARAAGRRGCPRCSA
jgi:hypothetical protein